MEEVYKKGTWHYEVKNEAAFDDQQYISKCA